jgi:hypothetical protein
MIVGILYGFAVRQRIRSFGHAVDSSGRGAGDDRLGRRGRRRLCELQWRYGNRSLGRRGLRLAAGLLHGVQLLSRPSLLLRQRLGRLLLSQGEGQRVLGTRRRARPVYPDAALLGRDDSYLRYLRDRSNLGREAEARFGTDPGEAHSAARSAAGASASAKANHLQPVLTEAVVIAVERQGPSVGRVFQVVRSSWTSWKTRPTNVINSFRCIA